MKQNSFKFLLSIVFLITTLANSAFAQTGKISGKVSDKATGETLIGLTVGVEGTTKGASTDIEGRYNLSLSPGTYSLSFRYLGYQTKNITGVTVTSGKVTSLDVIIAESSSQSLKEVVVIASFKQETVGALLVQQKNAVSISSGISADAIQKSPDRNTSDVLKRVSGTSIQNNKFVIIRGLSDRYNSSVLNNAILPSTEPDKKAFSFDIIPSNLVDKIVVYKTATADLPGDFAGGLIQVVTKDVPDQNFLSFGTTFGYNTQSTFNDFISNPRGKNEFLGFSDSKRNLPSGFPQSFQEYNPLSNQQKVEKSKLLENSYGEKTYQAAPNQNYQLTWGNRNDFKSGGSLGTIVSLTYRNSQNLVPILRQDYQDAFKEVYYRYNDTQSIYSTSLGLLANISYKKGTNKFSFKNLLNRVLDNTYTDRLGFNTNIDGDLKFNNSALTQKTIYNTQIEGDHLVGKKEQKLNWNLSYSLVKRDEPDLRSIYYRSNVGENDFEVVDRNSRRFFSALNENNYSGQVNYTLPFNIKNKKSLFKAGLLNLYKERDFAARIFNYQFNSSGDASFDKNILTMPKGSIFSEQNINNNGGFFLTDFTNNTDSYQAQSLLNAGYLMLDNKLGEKSRLVWGARVESYNQNIDFKDLSGTFRSFDQNFLDVLPSFNYTYSVSNKSNVRVSGSRTVSRPELRELAPFEFYDFVSQTSTLGNPNLKRAQISNADLRYEIYPKSNEAFTFSLFYKNFTNAIEQTLNEGGTPERRQVDFNNIKQANTFGAEVEIRKSLAFIYDNVFFKDLTFFSNISYIKSEVNVESLGLSTRPLQGQSPYLINAGLQYSEVKHGISFTALYNKVGQRISFVGNKLTPDIYENARDVLDLQLSKKIFKNKLDVKFNVANLPNQEVIFYFNQDKSTAYNAETDKVYTSNRLGVNYSLSLSYNFSIVK